MNASLSDSNDPLAAIVSQGVGAAVSGLVMRHCPHSHALAIARLSASVARHKMLIAAHVDHAASASRYGIHMRPTDLFIFGNPGVGSSMMKTTPTLAIDLPLKMLIWQTEADATMLAYNAPVWLADRHGVDAQACHVVGAMTDGLAAIADFIVSFEGIKVK